MQLEEFPQPDPVFIPLPVVLCHGFGAMGNLYGKGLMHDVAMMYREHCIVSFAPNIVPYARISIRAQAWSDHILKVKKSTGAQKVHAIAHSMAGLDLRYAIHKFELHKHLASLTTVSTPHEGTSLTGLTLNAPDSVQRSLAGIINWFGNNVYPSVPSDVLGALEELSPDYVKNKFNPSNPDHRDVKYFSAVASCGKGTDHPISKLLVPFNQYLFDREGLNDGYVSESGARYGRVIASTYLSHAEQIGLQLPNKYRAEWKRFWIEIAKILEKEKMGGLQ